MSYDVLHADGTPCLHDPEVTEIAGQDIVVLAGGRLDRCTGAVWRVVRPGDRNDEVIAQQVQAYMYGLSVLNPPDLLKTGGAS